MDSASVPLLRAVMGAPPPKNKPPKRRWLRRALLVALAVIGTLVLFHQPLLRWAVSWAGPKFAPMAGLKLNWTVEGSMTSDLALGQVRATGDGIVQRIESRRVSASYSLPDLVRHGVGALVKSVEIEDADVTIDLRAQSREDSVKSTAAPGAPPDVKIPRVSLRNINADIVTAQDEIVLRGFTLVLDDRKQGEIQIGELIVPSQKLHLMGVSGRTELQGQKIIITDLSVLYGLNITKLAVDITDLKAGTVAFELGAAAGQGVLSVVGRILELGRIVDAKLTLEHLSDDDFVPFGLVSEDVKWRIDSTTVRVSGPAAEPRQLAVDADLQASGIVVGNIKADTVAFKAGLKTGEMKLESLSIGSVTNAFSVSGHVAMPESWAQMASAAPQLKWTLKAPALEAFFANAPHVTGQLNGEGMVALDKGKLSGATASIDGSALKVLGVPMNSVKAEITTDADEVQVKSFRLQLDDHNTAEVSGSLNLAGSQRANLNWQIACNDLAMLAKSEGLKHLALPVKGGLKAEGMFDATLQDLQKADFSRLTAGAKARLDGFAWQEHPLKEALMDVRVADGRVELRELNVKLDEQNTAIVKGGMSITEALPFDLALQVDGRDLASIAKMAGVLNALLPEAGNLSLQSKARGSLRDLMAGRLEKLGADASIKLGGLKIQDGSLESLALEASVLDGRVDLKELALKLNGENIVTASGRMSLDAAHEIEAAVHGRLQKLSDFNGWMKLAKASPFTEGSAEIDWKGKGILAKPDINGAGSVAITGLRMEGMPDPLTLRLEARHEGAETEITHLDASSGKFRAAMQASVSLSALRVKQLTLSAGETKLIDGEMDIPLALAGDPRPAIPVDGTKPLNIRLRMDRLEFGELFRIAGQISPVNGVASMDADFHGLLPQLGGRLVVDLSRVEAMKDKLEPATAHLEAKLGEGKLSAHLVVDQRPLKTLDASAEIPLDVGAALSDPKSLMKAPLTARVSLPESELDFIKRLTPLISTIKGRLGMDVQISGAVSSPTMQGSLRADVPLALLTAPQAPEIKDLKTRISFEGEKINIEEISATLAGGSVKAGGTVNVKDLKNPGFDLKLSAQDALLVRDESVSQRANADLTCTGSLAKADISGRVDLTRGRVFKEIEFLPLTLPDQLPPPPPPAKRLAANGIKAPPPFDQWTFNVDIGTHDPVRLLGNVLNGGVLVDLHARGTGAAPTLDGKVTLEGARLRLPFSRLAINRGNIIFSKEKLLEPELDIEGDALVDRYYVTLAATGSAFDPKVRFSSSPPLSEGDIATLLATGATSEDLRSAEGVAANKAAFLFVTQMYRKIFRKAGQQHYDEEPPRLSFNFSLLNSGSTQRSVSAVYEVSPKVQAVGTISERGGFRGLLYYLIRLK